MHHGVTFQFGSAKVCLPVIFETCLFITKIYGLLQLIVFNFGLAFATPPTCVERLLMLMLSEENYNS